jgi:peptidoglycan/LPS O-acetylase OafA/YrhL
MRTIGSVLDERGGVSTGFDCLRVLLATGVLLIHSFALVIEKAQQKPEGLIASSVVPMFFVLSGFLVTSNALRVTFKNFLLNRIARILPAFFCVILFSVFVVGALFTSLPLKEYPTSDGVMDYFQNLTGFIHYPLTSVFTHNPYDDTVNRSLWTVPFEIACYGLVAVCIIFGLLARRVILLCMTLLIACIIYGDVGSDISVADALRLPQALHRIIAIIFLKPAECCMSIFFLGLCSICTAIIFPICP